MADELGRSPVVTDDPGLASIAQKYFDSWIAAKEKAGLKTFSKGRHGPRESEKIKMVKLSIRISNLADSNEIEPLAWKLAQLRGVNVGEQP